MKTRKSNECEKHSTSTSTRANAAVTLLLGMCSSTLAVQPSLAADTWSTTDSKKDGWQIRAVAGASPKLGSFFTNVALILPAGEYRHRTVAGDDRTSFQLKSSDDIGALAFVAYEPTSLTVRTTYWPDRSLLIRFFARSIQMRTTAVLYCTGFMNWNVGPEAVNWASDFSPPTTGVSVVTGCPGNQGAPTHVGGFFSARARML